MNSTKRPRLGGHAFRRVLVSVPAVAIMMFGTPAFGASDHFKNSDAPKLNYPQRPMTAEMQQIKTDNEAEHARELAILHIKTLRGGHNGLDPDAPNAANYDEALANPWPYKSNVLTFTDGKPVTAAAEWTSKRRAEIVSIFEQNYYGRIPAHVPGVKWEVTSTKNETVGHYQAVTKHVTGHVDNSADPAIKVDIQMEVTLPANVKGRVPVIIEYSWLTPPVFPKGFKMPYAPPGPSWKEQILALGWGYAVLDPTSVQADNAAGFGKGIIGLVNKGKPRSMTDWGVLRAWGWGAGRALEYLKSDPHVAGDEIGIAGHSRYGKAAIVTMAFDQRFAIAYVSSSGGAGAKLFHRNVGETLEDIAAPHQFHWIAGNFLKYAADPNSPATMPLDQDALIALCAPRPVFIGGGAAAAGDAWVDAKGMFMAAVDAGPVYRLLGKKDLGTDKFPAMGTALLDGDIGFRQHSFGHTQDPNWPTFLTFAKRYLNVRSY